MQCFRFSHLTGFLGCIWHWTVRYFWLFQAELQIYFSSKSLKNLVKLQRSENSNRISDWHLGHRKKFKNWLMDPVNKLLCRFESYSNISWNHRSTKIQMWLFKKNFGSIVDTLYHRRLNCGVFQFFLSKFAMWNEPRSISLLKDLIKRQWLFTYCIVKCFITQTKQSSN